MKGLSVANTMVLLLLLCACATADSGALQAEPPAEASVGDTWVRLADDMVMVYVPAGEFPYGPGSASNVPGRRFYLDAFWIDRTEVTNAQYARCVADSACLAPLFTVPYEDPDRFDHPVVAISQGEAQTYCEWVGGHLPLEIEWEKAARGTDGRAYPWGDAFDSTRVNYYWTDHGGTQPVGSYPAGASPYGALDMAGNASEWVQERWRGLEEYLDNPLSRRCEGSPPVGYHVTMRGGSWASLETSLPTYFRTNDRPTWRTKATGFRCVVSAVAADRPPSPTPTESLPPIPSSLLSQVGPWGLLRTRDSLWAVNADGSGLTHLLREDGIILEFAASPAEVCVVFVTADNIETLTNLRLKYLTLPDGAVGQVTPLLPPGTEITESHTGDPLYEATRSVRRASLAWSPDCRQLAFIGAQGGASADVYVYSLDTGKIVRLSDEPGQAYSPSWSPSGESIFFPSVRHFGTGAGYTMEAAWIARTDGGGTRLLYEPMSMGKEVVNWIDDETVWLYSWSDVFSNIDLRAVNINTGHTETLWADSFTALAHDPQSGTVMLGLNGLAPYRDPSGQRQKGIYLIVPGGKDPQQLAEVDVSKIVWSPEASRFFVASREGMLAVWPSGRIEWVDEVAPGFPVAAPGGRTWAWASEGTIADFEPGLWVGPPAEPPRRVLEAPASVVGWSPDGQALFFASDGLYVASAPDFTPMRISEALDPIGGITWVLP